MVENVLIPWQHESIIVNILTTRQITEKEKNVINTAFTSKCGPYGPYPSIYGIVEEVRKKDKDLAGTIICVGKNDWI